MTWLLIHSHAGIRSRTCDHMQVHFKNSQGVKASYTGRNVQIFWSDPSRQFSPEIANHTRISAESPEKIFRKLSKVPPSCPRQRLSKYFYQFFCFICNTLVIVLIWSNILVFVSSRSKYTINEYIKIILSVLSEQVKVWFYLCKITRQNNSEHNSLFQMYFLSHLPTIQFLFFFLSLNRCNSEHLAIL